MLGVLTLALVKHGWGFVGVHTIAWWGGGRYATSQCERQKRVLDFVTLERLLTAKAAAQVATLLSL